MKVKITSAQVDDAWKAFEATQKAIRSDPALIENEYFKAIQDTAYARFLLAYEVMEVDPKIAERFQRGHGQ